MSRTLSSLVSLLILAVSIATAASIPTHLRNPFLLQVQDQEMISHQQIWDRIADIDKRVSTLEQDAAKLQGVVIGFGALLAIIQGLQLIGFRRDKGKTGGSS